MEHPWASGLAGALSFDEARDPVTIASFMGGVCLWDIVRFLLFDRSVICGHKGCIWGFLFFYIPCRYFAVATIVSTLVMLNAPWLYNYLPLMCVNRVFGLTSLGFSFSIMTIKVVSAWKQIHIGWFMATSHALLWAFVLRHVCEIRNVAPLLAPPLTLISLCLYMSTMVLVLGVLGAILARKESDTNRDIASQLRLHGVHYLLPAWIMIWPCAITTFIRSPNTTLTFIVTYTYYIVTVVCAARIYIDMVRDWSSCPVGRYCVVWKLCKHTYLNGVKYITLENAAVVPSNPKLNCPFKDRASFVGNDIAMETLRFRASTGPGDPRRVDPKSK